MASDSSAVTAESDPPPRTVAGESGPVAALPEPETPDEAKPEPARPEPKQREPAPSEQKQPPTSRLARAWHRGFPWWRQLVAVASGLLLYTSFPPRPLWFLAPVAVAALTLVLRDRNPAARRLRTGRPRRTGVLRAAAALGRRVRGPAALAGPGRRARALPRAVRSGRAPGRHAAGLAGVDRGGLVAGGMAPLGLPVRRIPLGAVGFRPAGRDAAADRGAGRRAAVEFRGGTDRHRARRARARAARPARARAWHAATATFLAAPVLGAVLWPFLPTMPMAGRSWWPRCRAACRGWDWISTPSDARCWTTTFAPPSGWRPTSRPGGRPSRTW